MIIAITTILFAAAVAYANGANDVSKGVSTLVGSGRTTYRRGLAWGTFWTVAGALVAVVASAGLVRTFSAQLVDGVVADATAFPLAVAAGAFGWVMIASKTGLPVSTTHSLTGAIVGAAVTIAGTAGVQWSLLAATVAVPLAVSPFVSGLAAYTLHAIAARPLARASRYCVCVSEHTLVPVIRGSNAVAEVAAVPLPGIVVDQEATCAEATVPVQLRMTDAAHWGTSAALSFARGLNDNPKIIALGMLAASAAGMATSHLFLAGALMMGLGSYFFGRRVTETLAERVTHIDPLEGLAASGVAASLVILASVFALPVSTTHVVSGAIVGAGLRSGTQAVRWKVVTGIAAAWVVTLPASAVLAAAASLLMSAVLK